MTDNLKELQDHLGYRFRDPALLDRALTHPSTAPGRKEAGSHNQRLEFLGDAVLQLILTETLFTALPGEREGPLTRRRAALVQGRQLARIARELGLDRHLRMSPSEREAGGHLRTSALEDAFEALVGAVYLDGGMDAARPAVLRWFGDLSARSTLPVNRDNPKGRLQEHVQPLLGNNALEYRILAEQGPLHNRRFEAGVWLLGECIGCGNGSTKREAEENAAAAALESGRLPGTPAT